MPKNTRPPSASEAAREEFGNQSALRVAQWIGTFADEPPDSRYQEAYLAELWNILRAKMPK